MIELISHDTPIARPVAPEDIRVGDYIAPMNESMQFVLRGCDQDWSPGDREPRIHVMSARMVDSMPRVMRVVAVAVPFILVEDSSGCTSLVTCRLVDFARLPPEMGRRAMREADRRHREEAAKRRKRSEQRRARQDRPGAGAEGAD